MEDTFLKIIGNIGVPAAIALYILTQVTPALQKLTESLNHNTQVLSVLLAKIDCDEELEGLLWQGGRRAGDNHKSGFKIVK
ncbi:MAG: hypothetical protein WCY05_06810 [Candidatus Omnitrophota bacterium]